METIFNPYEFPTLYLTSGGMVFNALRGGESCNSRSRMEKMNWKLLVISVACLLSCASGPCSSDPVPTLSHRIHNVANSRLLPAASKFTIELSPSGLVLERDADRHNQTSFRLPLSGAAVRGSPPTHAGEEKHESISQGRMLVKEFLSPHQAERLRKIGMVPFLGKTAKEGTAFSSQVQYLGLSPQAAVQAVEAGSVAAEDARLYLTVTERIRHKIKEQFNLRTELYHHFTHIVCRSPSVEAPLVSEGAYLPAHSDNCNFNISTGQCHYSPKAFTWRHYTSLLYLHEDFEGGHFFFSHGTHNIQPEMWVKPRTGQLLAFTAGEENIHGVTHTVRGVRCVLEQWFTIDPHYHDSLREAQHSISQRHHLS